MVTRIGALGIPGFIFGKATMQAIFPGVKQHCNPSVALRGEVGSNRRCSFLDLYIWA
jgi:hypothetical protein